MFTRARLLVVPFALLLLQTGCERKWQAVDASPAGFIVEMPGNPEHTSENTYVLSGTVPTHTYAVELDLGRTAYQAEGTDFGGDAPADWQGSLNESRDAVLAAFANSRVISESDRELENGAAKDLAFSCTFEGERCFVDMRMIWIGSNFYQLLVFKQDSAEPDENVKRFFDSFEPTAG